MNKGKEMKRIRYIALATLLAATAGCTSGYSQFYKSVPGATPDAIAAKRAGPAPEIPILERAAPASAEEIDSAYGKRGYTIIGYSMFNSGRGESESAALKQGQAVGADLVLVFNPQYTGTITSQIPITTPTTTTSYSSGSATAYGPGTPVTAYGSSTTTTYGSRTTYMPMAIHRSDYGAVYFIKQRFRLGASVRPLTDEERQQLETNQGVVIITIVDGTPAFNADLLPGDIITAINGKRVSSPETYSSLLESERGNVTLDLIRKGQPISKSVALAQ